ncbi:hypothetical protein SDC9_61734 [bioreactor metagenome]|uniref:Uncharacterized protein n=1 Tax=bioreactor metagenome TaxID=1076179 RepID=A0A644XGL6_9ZZZZ
MLTVVSERLIEKFSVAIGGKGIAGRKIVSYGGAALV